MCYIVVVLRDMVKERWWSATDIKHRKHVKTCYLRDRVSLGLGFRDKVRVRVKVRVSFRLATFMYSVWPPVSVKVRVNSGISISTGDLYLGISRTWVTLEFRVNITVYGYG